MHRRHHMIDSPTMGRAMHVWAFGHFGQPVVIFPSAAGFAHEWDAHGMVEALSPLIDRGKLKLYCPESNVSETWTNKGGDLGWRMKRHRDYELFITETLVPAIRADCNSPDIRMGAAGCSLGGFYAANFALKFPEVFRFAVCMSGRYDIASFTGGQSSMDVYFNNPVAYVSNLDGEHLERVRRGTHLTLVCGRGKWEEGCIEETHALSDICARKGISHERDIWGHDVNHQWDWWRRQAVYHFHKALT